MYRCGNTFSQTPCGAAAASALRISAAAAPEPASGPRGKELCNSAAPRLLQLNNPETTRIESVVKGSSEVIQYAGQPAVARKYLMSINATNAYGVYMGAKTYACFLSEDEQRILSIALKL
jgi:hypothetical protein